MWVEILLGTYQEIRYPCEMEWYSLWYGIKMVCLFVLVLLHEEVTRCFTHVNNTFKALTICYWNLLQDIPKQDEVPAERKASNAPQQQQPAQAPPAPPPPESRRRQEPAPPEPRTHRDSQRYHHYDGPGPSSSRRDDHDHGHGYGHGYGCRHGHGYGHGHSRSYRRDDEPNNRQDMFYRHSKCCREGRCNNAIYRRRDDYRRYEHDPFDNYRQSEDDYWSCRHCPCVRCEPQKHMRCKNCAHFECGRCEREDCERCKNIQPTLKYREISLVNRLSVGVLGTDDGHGHGIPPPQPGAPEYSEEPPMPHRRIYRTESLERRPGLRCNERVNPLSPAQFMDLDVSDQCRRIQTARCYASLCKLVDRVRSNNITIQELRRLLRRAKNSDENFTEVIRIFLSCDGVTDKLIEVVHGLIAQASTEDDPVLCADLATFMYDLGSIDRNRNNATTGHRGSPI